jgi:hypothetical protein
MGGTARGKRRAVPPPLCKKLPNILRARLVWQGRRAAPSAPRTAAQFVRAAYSQRDVPTTLSSGARFTLPSADGCDIPWGIRRRLS